MAKCGDKLISYKKCTWTLGGFYILDPHLGVKGPLQVYHLVYGRSLTSIYSIYICVHH